MDIIIKDFIKEDLGEGDITTDAIVPEHHASQAIIMAKAEGVVAGHQYARDVFTSLDQNIQYQALQADGERVKPEDLLAAITGKSRAILTGERVALNILQRLSGIATFTRSFVDAVEGTGVKILDTRKTTPGLRGMEKYAVRLGGGYNHRLNLGEMALIKENHIAMAGSILEAVKRVRAQSRVPIEVEVKDMDELQEALDATVDRIMLDNWDTKSIRDAVSLIKTIKEPALTKGSLANGPLAKGPPSASAPAIEVSGNMTVEKVREMAKTGIDFISVGAITHSFTSLDMTLLLKR
jgi:nicotinate-nucleotide pyrophosphorylase (carboxylating)